MKTVPDPDVYNTLAPDMDYIYFEGAKRFPFERRAVEYSPVNAWWLSEAAFLAYCHPGFVRMAWQLAGFPNFRFFNGPGTECMVASSNKAAIVAFRGTEINSRSVFHEVGTDLNTLPVPFPEGGSVHQGFLLALEEVWEEKGKEYRKKHPGHNSGLGIYLRQLLKERPQRPLWVCGHSLGGALATLCFARLPEAHGLYIYGAPKVGDAEFTVLLGNRPVYRFEHAADPVPLVPPEIPRLQFHFKETGILIFISRAGERLSEKPRLEKKNGSEIEKRITNEKAEQERAIARSWMKLPRDVLAMEQNLDLINTHVKKNFRDWAGYLEKIHNEYIPRIEDHMPVYYAVKLWNLLISNSSK